MRMLSTIRSSLIWPRSSIWNVGERQIHKIKSVIKSAKKYAMVSEDENRKFMAVFPNIVKDLADATRDTPQITEKFVESLHYNVPNGTKNRGLAVVAAYKMLEKEENLTADNVRLANIMGWCVELLQAAIIVIDDVFDHAETRRGLVCWHKKEEIKLRAIVDGLLIKEGIGVLLKKYFSNHHCYKFVMAQFNDIYFKCCKAQALDFLCSPDSKPNFKLFTMDEYLMMIRHKTGYYNYTMPVSLAMFLANVHCPEMQKQANTILVELGAFFQIQNDFLDCYGDPKGPHKEGNDISQGKCTWLAVVALEKANSAQKKIMEKYYGRSDFEAFLQIRNLYEKLNLRNAYVVYEEERFNMFRAQIQQKSEGLPPKLLIQFLRNLFQRDC